MTTFECQSCDILLNDFSWETSQTIMRQLDNDCYPVFLQLYYDDFEPANPLGSKAVVHKLGGFYFNILNFPAKYNSSVDMVHLVALAYTLDIKKHGMNSILRVIMDELLELEKGFVITNKSGVEHKVCVVLAHVVADNLGLHGFLRYTEGFRSEYS